MLGTAVTFVTIFFRDYWFDHASNKNLTYMYSFLFEYEPIYRSLKRLTSIKRQDKRVWLTIIYLFLFKKKIFGTEQSEPSDFFE